MTIPVEGTYRELESQRRDIDYLMSQINALTRRVDDLETELKDVRAKCDYLGWERS